MARRYCVLVSTLELLAGVGIVAVTALVVTRRLGPPTAASFVLTAYVAGFAEIVVLTLALSVVNSLLAWTLLAGAALVLAAALALPTGRLSPRTSLLDGVAGLRGAFREPIVAVLAIAVAASLVYSAALGVLTPPNDWDAMTYHLARAAFWMQQQGVGYVPESDVLRINVNPPNAEIGTLFTMLLSDGDRFVGLVQYAALLATAVGTYGISCRIGLDRPAALFGALLLLTTPVIILQGSTAQNDLVVASFLVAATYFLLGETKREAAFGGLALALAIGAKFTAVIALPLVALVVFAGQPRRCWPRLAIAYVVGGALGSYWLVVNFIETGSLDGNAGEVLDQHADRRPEAVLARATRLLVNFADDMNLGRDAFVYALAAAVFLFMAVALERRRLRTSWLFVVAACAVACLPLAVALVRERLLRVHEKLWLTLGEPDLAALDVEREAWSPSTVFSYYGPLGFVLLLTATLLVARDVRRRAVRPLAVLLAAAPLMFTLLVAFALVYDPWRGRFFMFPMALAAATWGVVLRRRWIAWGVSSIAAVTLLLAFVHSIEKPAGVRLLEQDTATGVWGKPREVVQTWLRGDGTAEVVQYFARERVSGRVGLRLGEDDWVYPYFGQGLDREVFFVPVGANLHGFDWLVFHPGRVEQPGPEWSIALQAEDGWRVYRRVTEE